MQSDPAYLLNVQAKLQSRGLSPQAAEFVTKSLHPVVGSPVQIPDPIAVPTVNPEYRIEQTFTAPTSYTSMNTNWDLLLISPPSDRVAFYYALAPAGTDFRSFNQYVSAAGTPSNSQGVAGYTTSVGVAEGTTTTCVVIQNSLSTPTLVPNVVDLSFASTQGLAQWRGVSRSLTAYATGSELYNQGTVYGGQFARTPSRSVGGNASGVLYVPEFVDLPLSETDLSLLTVNLYTAPAREGAYTIHRLTGPTQEFVAPSNPVVFNSNNLLTGSAYLSNSTNIIASAPTVLYTPAMSLPVFPNYNVNPPVASPLSGFFPQSSADVSFGSTSFDTHQTWGVMIFRGMNPNMSITVKSVFSIEFVPTVVSPARQFLKAPCSYDPMALSAYYAIANNIPDTVASKHNFLGTLLAGIGSVASKVLPYVGQALAPLLGDAIKGFGGAVEQKLSAPAQPAPAVRPPPMMPRSTSQVTRSLSLGPRTRAGASRRVKVAKKKKTR